MEKIKAIVSSLAELDTQQATNKLEKYASEIKEGIRKQNNDERYDSLEILERFFPGLVPPKE